MLVLMVLSNAASCARCMRVLIDQPRKRARPAPKLFGRNLYRAVKYVLIEGHVLQVDMALS